MRNNNQPGFTIIELLMAMIAGSILIFAAGMLLSECQSSWNGAWTKVNLQRDASYAMQRISGIAKTAVSAEIENSNKTVKIFRQDDWVRIFLDDQTGDLKYEIQGEQAQVFIEENVLAIFFEIEGTTLKVDLKLLKDNQQAHYTSSIMMRNFEK